MLRLTKCVTASLTVFAVLAAGACADEGAAPQGDAGTNTLSISATGVDSLPFMAILQAGINKKWFEEEGLTVDLFSGGGGGNTLRVVTSGDADVASRATARCCWPPSSRTRTSR